MELCTLSIRSFSCRNWARALSTGDCAVLRGVRRVKKVGMTVKSFMARCVLYRGVWGGLLWKERLSGSSKSAQLKQNSRHLSLYSICPASLALCPARLPRRRQRLIGHLLRVIDLIPQRVSRPRVRGPGPYGRLTGPWKIPLPNGSSPGPDSFGFSDESERLLLQSLTQVSPAVAIRSPPQSKLEGANGIVLCCVVRSAAMHGVANSDTMFVLLHTAELQYGRTRHSTSSMQVAS
ncbi:hypothetical protein BDW75DRAFT_56424 [Aspergillus navahoensis]